MLSNLTVYTYYKAIIVNRLPNYQNKVTSSQCFPGAMRQFPANKTDPTTDFTTPTGTGNGMSIGCLVSSTNLKCDSVASTDGGSRWAAAPTITPPRLP